MQQSSLEARIVEAADLIEQCLRVGKKLLVCGDGGAAADVSQGAVPRKPAICPTRDGGLLTTAGNDYGFDEIFARPIAAFGAPGYVLICLATSGKSEKCEARWKKRKRAN